MPRLSPVLTVADLPLAELLAARLDGEVYVIGDGFAPIDEFEQAHHRALSLVALARPRFIAERHTASWVYGARAEPPRRHEFCVSHEARARATDARRFTLREVVIPEPDIRYFGSPDGALIGVTAPLRTAIDLLRAEAPFDSSSETEVLSLLNGDGGGLAACRDSIRSRHKLAGKRRAEERLTRLELR